jgi:acid phosphatase family membrane protein YuiD
MSILDVFQNQVFIAAMMGWFVAQVLKIPAEYLPQAECHLHTLQ